MLAHMGPPTHPERPDRLLSIILQLQAAAILPGRLVPVPPREATVDELRTVHEDLVMEQVAATAAMAPFEGPISPTWGDAYAGPGSTLAASLAAGTTVEVTDRVATGEIDSGLALVRPPGHHAECSKCMGFCLYNNVGVAAAVALDRHQMTRILIVDWDIHHGNGTQEMFWNDPRVLYVSLHRYPFYPGPSGDPGRVGSGEGMGFNINVAWPMAGVGDGAYVEAFERLVMPVGRAYDPELVVISCGFDAAEGDPLGECAVTPAGYGHMTRELMELARGKVVVALEGGYNLRSISRSMEQCARALLGEREAIDEAVRIQAKFWPVLRSDPSVIVHGILDVRESSFEQLSGGIGDDSGEYGVGSSFDSQDGGYLDSTGGDGGDGGGGHGGGDGGGDGGGAPEASPTAAGGVLQQAAGGDGGGGNADA
eukprot:g2026.t1